eukprot:146334-Chlamydomonas_euryale.AAC.1
MMRRTCGLGVDVSAAANARTHVTCVRAGTEACVCMQERRPACACRNGGPRVHAGTEARVCMQGLRHACACRNRDARVHAHM